MRQPQNLWKEELAISTSHLDAALTFCLHCVFWIIVQSATATSITSGWFLCGCVLDITELHTDGIRKVQNLKDLPATSYLYLKIWSPKDLLFIYLGTCTQCYSKFPTQKALCFGLCLSHIKCSFNTVLFCWNLPSYKYRNHMQNKLPLMYFCWLFYNNHDTTTG